MRSIFNRLLSNSCEVSVDVGTSQDFAHGELVHYLQSPRKPDAVLIIGLKYGENLYITEKGLSYSAKGPEAILSMSGIKSDEQLTEDSFKRLLHTAAASLYLTSKTWADKAKVISPWTI